MCAVAQFSRSTCSTMHCKAILNFTGSQSGQPRGKRGWEVALPVLCSQYSTLGPLWTFLVNTNAQLALERGSTWEGVCRALSPWVWVSVMVGLPVGCIAYNHEKLLRTPTAMPSSPHLLPSLIGLRTIQTHASCTMISSCSSSSMVASQSR